MLVTEGYPAGVPALRQAVSAFRGRDVSREEGLRWLGLAANAAALVWDDEAWHLLFARQVQLARDTGALSVLGVALNGLLATLWVPETPSPHATWVYSWIRPPSRSRRRTRTLLRRAGGCSRPEGGLWRSVRCGRWTL